MFGREERQRVVAPVVRQAALDQVAVVDVVVDGHQLDRRDAELQQMARSPRRCVSAA